MYNSMDLFPNHSEDLNCSKVDLKLDWDYGSFWKQQFFVSEQSEAFRRFTDSQVSPFMSFLVTLVYALSVGLSIQRSTLEARSSTLAMAEAVIHMFLFIVACLGGIIPSTVIILRIRGVVKNNLYKFLVPMCIFAMAADCLLYLLRDLDGRSVTFPGIKLMGRKSGTRTDDLELIKPIFLLLLPFLAVTILKETRVKVAFALWLINLIAIVYSSIHVNSAPLLFMGCLYLLVSAVIIVEVQFQHFRVFSAFERLKDALHQIEEITIAQRHMIANVAHDLKTPLSSFMVGTELIQQQVDDILSGVTVDAVSDSLRIKIQSIRNDISDIRSTNAFMVMTINRCIDFTKAGQGLKLVPKNETVDILETVSLPLLCMRNAQQKVQLALSSLPEGLCSHIVTDKQWLQENLLCLLSNASKYSDGGIVTVTLSMVPSLNTKGQTDLLIKHTSSRTISSKTTKIDKQSSICLTASSMSIGDVDGISSREPMQLMVEVQDEGIGVPEELMDQLFSPFQQTQRLAGGTGLGLYSLAKRVDALGGSCGVRRRADCQQGSVFWFSIPYRPDELSASMSVDDINSDIFRPPSIIIPALSVDLMGRSTSQSSPFRIPKATGAGSPTNSILGSPDSYRSTYDGPKLSVLLAEDSPTISKVQVSMLRRMGHHVHHVDNGLLALQAFEASLSSGAMSTTAELVHYDVVLMDLQMPVMDGLEATRRMRLCEMEHMKKRGSSASNRQRIIGVSANSDEETVQAAYAMGIDAFLAKPFTKRMFEELVASFPSSPSP